MIFNEDELPEDVESLRTLVLDLARRLQNAQHTIDAERKLAAQAQRQVEYFRTRLAESVRSFRLEAARVRNTDFKNTLLSESKKYEDNKSKGTNLHEQLRMLELDHTMTGNRHFVPVKLQRMRNQAKQLEAQQDSQKASLQQMNEQIQLQERLTTAIQQGNINQVIYFLRMGVDTNYVDSAGYLPLHHACVYGQYQIAEILLEWGSDYTSFLSGQAPIVLAAQHGHVNLLRLLLDYGASVEESGKAGVPPLHTALQQGHYSVVDFLLQQGALANTVDRMEMTPLHLATRLPLDIAVNVIGMLMEHGADLHRVNKSEHTPLQMALYEKHHDIAQLLRQHFEAQQQRSLDQIEREFGDNNNINNNENPPASKGEQSGAGTADQPLLQNVTGSHRSSVDKSRTVAPRSKTNAIGPLGHPGNAGGIATLRRGLPPSTNNSAGGPGRTGNKVDAAASTAAPSGQTVASSSSRRQSSGNASSAQQTTHQHSQIPMRARLHSSSVESLPSKGTSAVRGLLSHSLNKSISTQPSIAHSKGGPSQDQSQQSQQQRSRGSQGGSRQPPHLGSLSTGHTGGPTTSLSASMSIMSHEEEGEGEGEEESFHRRDEDDGQQSVDMSAMSHHSDPSHQLRQSGESGMASGAGLEPEGEDEDDHDGEQSELHPLHTTSHSVAGGQSVASSVTFDP